ADGGLDDITHAIADFKIGAGGEGNKQGCHCEERSDEAIHFDLCGLLRCARNDDLSWHHLWISVPVP
ncbi:hypothetical protein QIG43_27885, partial [Klebsiella pneumoniae]|nr:hypothetical protein [Klebsiella pneumoniae]